MVQPLNYLPETASQTAGPYVHIGLMPTYAGNANYYQQEIGVSPISGEAKGQIIEIVGSVYDPALFAEPARRRAGGGLKPFLPASGHQLVADESYASRFG